MKIKIVRVYSFVNLVATWRHVKIFIVVKIIHKLFEMMTMIMRRVNNNNEEVVITRWLYMK